jgi:hypothetical protein
MSPNISSKEPEDAEIKSLINRLSSRNRTTRSEARESLRLLGHTAVDYLSELLTDKKKINRWEAVKTLVEISDPHSGALFLFALKDEDPGIRWLAAEGLISLGKQGVITTLEGLISNFDSVYFRHGAHHVFKEYSKKHPSPEIKKLLSSLLRSDSGFYSPVMALRLLRKFRKDTE